MRSAGGIRREASRDPIPISCSSTSVLTTPAHTAYSAVKVEMDGEEILDASPDIGYHHRGAEKMGERQSWHTFIPYTDRVDYLAAWSMTSPIVMAVERLAGIEVPERAKVIRVMMAELFRIASHLVWYGTFAQDLGALSPVFYTFYDREVIFEIIEAITRFPHAPHLVPHRRGGRRPAQGVGAASWLIFSTYMPPRLTEYDAIVMGNRIIKARTKGVGAFTRERDAIEWGMHRAQPARRAVWRGTSAKRGPIPATSGSSSTSRQPTTATATTVRGCAVEEIRQSLRIIEQCLENMPGGPYKSDKAAHYAAA